MEPIPRNLSIIIFLPIYATVIVLNIITVIFFIHKFQEKRRQDLDASFDIGIALFLVFYIFFGNFLKIMAGTTISATLAEIFGPAISLLIINLILFMAGEFALVSLIIILYIVENKIWNKATHFFITISYIIYLILITILGLVTQFAINTIIFPYFIILTVLTFILPVLYYYLGTKMKGDNRKFAVVLGTGFLLIFLGVTIIFLDLTQQNYLVPRVFENVMIIIGFALILYSSRWSNKTYS